MASATARTFHLNFLPARMPTLRKLVAIGAFLCLLTAQAAEEKIRALFSPDGGCTEAIVEQPDIEGRVGEAIFAV